jgi:hypothetical protein
MSLGKRREVTTMIASLGGHEVILQPDISKIGLFGNPTARLQFKDQREISSDDQEALIEWSLIVVDKSYIETTDAKGKFTEQCEVILRRCSLALGLIPVRVIDLFNRTYIIDYNNQVVAPLFEYFNKSCKNNPIVFGYYRTFIANPNLKYNYDCNVELADYGFKIVLSNKRDKESNAVIAFSGFPWEDRERLISDLFQNLQLQYAELPHIKTDIKTSPHLIGSSLIIQIDWQLSAPSSQEELHRPIIQACIDTGFQFKSWDLIGYRLLKPEQ